MLERDEAMNLLEIALRYSTADQTEVMLSASEHGLTRLANNSVHQHVAVTNGSARVRVVVGKKIGVVSSNALKADDIKTLIDRAIAIARVSEPNSEFVSLPAQMDKLAGLAGAVPTSVTEPSAEAISPERRAALARVMVQTAVGNGVSAFGNVSATISALAVGNTLGVRSYHKWSDCGVMAIAASGEGSGYASWAGTTLADAPVEAVAARACKKCVSSETPIAIDPGKYTVILEAPAVAEMLTMLAYVGLGATAFQEERSFMSGNLGNTLVGKNVTLRDDTYHPRMITLPFDFEGTPRQVVPFFEHGVARGVVYDSFTAHKEHRSSTGHALPAPNAYGPMPMNLVLDEGGHSMERMIREVERGILVTRFHYVNIVHPKETTLTGMTRDGTFLIENGSITRSLKNMRFTQSVLDALSNVSALENTQTLINQEGIYCLVPSLRIEGFSFTS